MQWERSETQLYILTSGLEELPKSCFLFSFQALSFSNTTLLLFQPSFLPENPLSIDSFGRSTHLIYGPVWSFHFAIRFVHPSSQSRLHLWASMNPQDQWPISNHRGFVVCLVTTLIHTRLLITVWPNTGTSIYCLCKNRKSKLAEPFYVLGFYYFFGENKQWVLHSLILKFKLKRKEFFIERILLVINICWKWFENCSKFFVKNN